MPWLSAFGIVYPSIFSLTGSSINDPTAYPDANGLTHYTLDAYGPLLLDHNVNIIKYCIQTHDITDFFIFDYGAVSGLSVGLQALDFWNNVVENLVIDSQLSTVQSPGAVASTSSIFFGGKLYTRSQFNEVLRAFYPNLLI